MEPPIGKAADLDGVFEDTVGCLRRLHHLYGNCVAYPKSEWLTVFAFGPEFNYPTFSDAHLFHLSGYPGPKGSSQRLFKYGLFGLNGDIQLKHRRLLMPTFSKGAVDGSFAPMAELTDRALAEWRLGDTVDLGATCKEFALQVTGRLLFGLEDFEAAHAVADTFNDWLDHYHMVLFAANLPIDLPAGAYERMMDAADRLVGHLRQILAFKRRTMRPDDRDILAILLRSQDAGVLSDAEVIGEMLTLVNAAYQTTSFGLMWTLFLLAQHPTAARTLLEEQRGIVGADALTPEHLPRLNYLNYAIKEALRILPPVVYTQRWATDTAPFGRYTLPKYSMVIPSYYVSHHLPEVFARPETFAPERWVGATFSPWEYLPFSAGPRMCMGATFATLLFKIAVTAIWRRFRLEVMPGATVNRHANLTLGITGTLPVRLHAQDGRFTTSPVSGDILEMVTLPLPAVERRAA
ncbi:MAG: cytochrome P450 [Gemmataceae bacterium]